MLEMRQKLMSLKLDNWKGWTFLWLALFIVPSLSVWYYSVYIYLISLLSGILLGIYQFVFIPYLEKRKIGLRANLKEKMNQYRPEETDYDYDKISQKIGMSVTVFSALASVTFSLIVFSLGFIYLADVTIGLNIDSFLIFGMLTPLIIAGIYYLISLDQYDTSADPSLDVDTKWKMRQLALEYFVSGWRLLILGIFIGLSLIHPFLTLIGCCWYVCIHNRFWFQPLE